MSLFGTVNDDNFLSMDRNCYECYILGLKNKAEFIAKRDFKEYKENLFYVEKMNKLIDELMAIE
jgi:hypothetical protein